MTSGMRLVRRIARPRTGSGSISSFGVKKSSAPENRSVKACGQLKMNSGLSMRFMILGAEVPHSSSAGPLAALTKRWNAFSGMVNNEPFCHSNACFLLCPSCQTSVEPRPSDENDLFIEMPFRIESTGARNLDDVAAPKAFRAVKLNVGSAPAEAAPWLHGQVLHPAHADAAIDRHALRFHEAVIGHGLSLERAEPCVLARLGFVPVILIRPV